MTADLAADLLAATEELQHAYESTLESAIGRCMLLGFMPDRIEVTHGYPNGCEAHPVKVLDKHGTVLASIWVRNSLDPPEIQLVRVFSDAVLTKVRERLGAGEA